MKKTILLPLYFLSIGFVYSQDTKTKAWELTEIWDPEPKVVNPGNSFRDAPSDAIVLFDGLNLDKWVHKNGEPAKWDIKDGFFEKIEGLIFYFVGDTKPNIGTSSMFATTNATKSIYRFRYKN